MNSSAPPQPTVNENPTVLQHVDPRRRRVVPEQHQLPHFSSPSTVSDWAVRRALTEAALSGGGDQNSNKSAVMLLKSIGVEFPNAVETAPFVYAPMPWPGQVADEVKQDKNTTAAINTNDDDDDDNVEESSDEVYTVDDVFEIIRNIQDPEHPLTLEQLGVVSREQIVWYPPTERMPRPRLQVRFTPTIPHCSMATQIGLCLRVKLDRSLPPRIKTTVKIEPGTHASEDAINKQLADKERVCAALENKHLVGIVNRCIMNGMTGNMV